MAPMIRKQIYIEQRHDRILKRRAKQRGVTEAEIIREALELTDAGRDGRRTPPTPDPAAAQKALAFMRALSRRSSHAPAGRGWTRESLYEDRLRWPRS